jgi:homoaconitate hydratase
MAGQTVTEKIAQLHKAEGPDRAWRAGDFVSIRPKHIMTHDNSAAVIKKFKGVGAKRVFNPRQPVFALDHDIQNTSEQTLKQYREIEVFAREHGIDFYPAGTGIGHQLMIEKGYVTPGSFVVASDSHSNMYGALGAVGTPVVRTDAAAVWATGEFWWQIPRTVQVVLEGRLSAGSSGKDVIVVLCGLYCNDALNAAVEFTGPGVASLSMDARLSIANMTTEWGALVGWFPPDVTTCAWMRERVKAGVTQYGEADIRRWELNPVLPDADAQYAARITLNLAEVTPHISGPDTVQVMTSVADAQTKKIAIQKAYLVSCANSRLEDLEAAARVLTAKKIAPTVQFYVAAASKEVQQAAEKSGAWQTLVSAGAQTLPPGCGPCIGLGTGLLEAGEVGISATNRNFKGRMGSREAKCYLASPEVVAASAMAGYVRAPQESSTATTLKRDFVALEMALIGDESVSILPGFPERLRGRLVFVPQDNLNTDGIYGKDYTYREDMTPEMMAQFVFANYDPQLAARTSAGDIIVGGFNFGTGSSREQAVTSLKAKGIPLVIAGSFSQTYLRNAFNNGFLCIEVPQLVTKLKETLVASSAAVAAVGATSEKSTESKAKTIIPGDELDIDFVRSVITWRGEQFRFPSLGTVPQALVIAGGAENVVAKKLGLR